MAHPAKLYGRIAPSAMRFRFLHREEIVDSTSRTFVAAEPPPMRTRTGNSIMAAWADNAGAGIGVLAVIVGLRVLAQIVGAGLGVVDSPLPSGESMAIWLIIGAVSGVVLFGVLMILRSALDEIVQYGEWSAMQAEIDELQAEALELSASADEYRRLYERAVEAASTARRDAHQAMRRESTSNYVAPEPDAVNDDLELDARMLLQIMYSPEPAGWKSITSKYADWTRARWTAARDLLEDAECVRTVGNQTKPVEATVDAGLAKLSAYCNETGGPTGNPVPLQR